MCVGTGIASVARVAFGERVNGDRVGAWSGTVVAGRSGHRRITPAANNGATHKNQCHRTAIELTPNAALRAQGVGSANIATVGVGSEKPLREERTEEDKQYNRSVSFRVVPAATTAGEAPR